MTNAAAPPFPPFIPSSLHPSHPQKNNVALSKAVASLDKYGLHMVIGNELATRKDKVYLFHCADLPGLRESPEKCATILRLERNARCIEEPLIAAVVRHHDAHVKA